MAIHNGYDQINTIKGLDTPWEGKTGAEVEDFISRRFKQPIHPDLEYKDGKLSIFDPETDADGNKKLIASGPITVVPPNYTTSITFPQITVNNVVNTNDIAINYTDNMKFVAGINVKTFYESIGNKYYLSNKVTLIFSIEGTTDQLIVRNIVPNEIEDDSLQLIDITQLFQKNLQNVKVKVSVSANQITDEAIYGASETSPDGKTVTVHKIEINTSSTHVDNKTVVFNISGLKTTTDMHLEYFSVPFGTDPKNVTKNTTSLTGTSSTDLVLPSTGPYQILARVSNTDGTFYSNWTQANVISYDSTLVDKPEMMGIIGNIPTKITNCENAHLYDIIYVPGSGGSIEITAYLEDEAGIFESTPLDQLIPFNQTSITTTSNDLPTVSSYYSYIELVSVGNSQKVIAFKLKVNDEEFPIYQLSVTSKGALNYANYFTINISENPYNINNAFNYTEGAREDFSQIVGQSTTFFSNINSDIEASDGWITDENLIAYKISAQNKNLFTQPKDMSTLLNSGQGFTIEVMLKNYNINGEDPVMNIGNLLFGPGFARVNSDDLSEEGIYVNSRADFEKEVMTHLMFIYEPNYKPKTYLNIYDEIFNENGVSYSDITHTYPILKIYVNGCINREIQISQELLKDDDGFKLQICPKTSDLNLYIFRTYTRALTYSEIQKNYISSLSKSQDKKNVYDRNNILSEDGKISFYKSMLNHNVIVFVLPVGEKPLFFGNKDTAGDGKSNATILVRYKDEKNKYASGRFTGGKYKAQGSSAKKYMFHNTQYSKGTFLSEEQIKNGITEGSSKYALPTDPEGIEAKKLVGKVNYASSMQSHKVGATKLYDRAYKEIFPERTLYNGGKKACLEEPFMYFYYNVKDNSQLNTITIEDLYTVSTINGITVAQDSDVKFLGFQTWGSAKADDPTYGYGDNTPEYVLFEGADNASPGANFKQPWAAFQTWNSTLTKKENQNTSGSIVQQPKSVTEKDHTTGLLIEGETIQFENDTDPLDVDYGVELLILEGQTKDDAEKRDLWKFTDAVKNNSLKYFVEFYNNCYQYDFTNIIPNPNSDQSKFDLTNPYDVTNKRVYMIRKTSLFEGETSKGEANTLDLYRWDGLKNQWVPAGLHYNNGNWETFNLKDIYDELKNHKLYLKYKNDPTIISEDFEVSFNPSQNSVNTYIIPAFKDMFKATCAEHVDINDVAYHQAFIKLVSGTDNRAKNTYFQIIGKLYEQDKETKEWIKTEQGDYKIRLMQDDLDTIFATDNNGQQVKPYYLLEPPFNTETEHMWGDEHSSFFYPFDVCYYELINQYLGKLIDHLFGSATSIKSVDSALYEYFFSVQKDFPEIAYNHHAEIYYEMPQVLFYNGEVLKENGQYVFPTTLNEFRNNNVKNPLSLSHGRCLESEYQFMKDRLIMLGTSTTTASGLYTSNEISLSTESTGGSNKTTTFKGTATFTDYFYPIKSSKTSGTSEYTKIGNITEKSQTPIKFASVFDQILNAPHIPNIISQLVTPNKEFDITSDIQTTMGAYLSAGNKYKSIIVNQGLDFTHSFLNLPNAKQLVINGTTAKYKITESSIIVKNFLPVIETLDITNTVFTNTTLDLRGCNRLETLDLSGCTGIVDIIFPENNRLSTVYLPSGIKKLTLGKNPNLSTFVFAEGTYLNDISLDCSSFNENFDYMDILNNRIDYSNLKQFILRNTPEEGLLITEDIATKMAAIKNNPNISKTIKGKFIITDRTEEINSDNIKIYIWGNETNISYNTKKVLVNAFGNIDLESNDVYFKYQVSTLIRSSYKLPQVISVDVPTGGITIKPFDGLYFTQGNNVGITDEGLLNISYIVNNLPSGSRFNPKTGELYVLSNTEQYYNYSIEVTLSTGAVLTEISGQLYLGYIEPAIGDFAYSDGTFSSIYDSDKTLVGLVFQKETISTGVQWKLGILSNTALNDYSGPDLYYKVITDGNSWAWSQNDIDQANIHTFMTHNTNGLGINMPNGPETDAYLGFGSEGQTSGDATIVDYNYLTSSPTTLVSSGYEDTHRLSEVGINRLKTIVNKSVTLRNYLINNGFLNDQGEFTNTWNAKTFDEICNKFDESVRNELNFNTSANYYKVLHPLALKTSIFEPENLTNKGVEYYSKGNWYIPSTNELELLIWYRIRSTATTTSANTQSYWDNTEYSKGDSIFSDKSVYFDSFLSQSTTMLASEVSPSNKNFIYGETTYYSSSTITKYGWFYNYIDGYWGNGDYHQSCRRDIKYSIAPCCTITVTKQN